MHARAHKGASLKVLLSFVCSNFLRSYLPRPDSELSDLGLYRNLAMLIMFL